MKHNIKVNKIGGDTTYMAINSPSRCPKCNTGLMNKPLYAVYNEDENEDSFIYLLMYCPYCKSVFYSCLSYDDGYTELYDMYPKFTKMTVYSSINKISPNFEVLFSQAEEAEKAKLDQICGMGYRKSLEFLIKDYAVYKHPADKDKIVSEQLAQVINNYIDNTQLKTLAKAATWLGNDETHYQKRFKEYDINQLKAFISTTMAVINAELMIEDANKILNNSKKVK